MTDAATLLWTDAAFGASAERAATRFAIVRDAVTRGHAIGVVRDTFLADAEEVGMATWSEPRAYWWARAAEAALPDDDALIDVLARFRRDAIDAARPGPSEAAASCGDYRVRVTPEPLAVPDWPLADPAVEAGPAFHAAHVGLIDDTLSTLAAAVPERFDEFRRVIR